MSGKQKKKSAKQYMTGSLIMISIIIIIITKGKLIQRGQSLMGSPTMVERSRQPASRAQSLSFLSLSWHHHHHPHQDNHQHNHHHDDHHDLTLVETFLSQVFFARGKKNIHLKHRPNLQDVCKFPQFGDWQFSSILQLYIFPPKLSDQCLESNYDHKSPLHKCFYL